MRIGTVDLTGRVVLAPMAGVTDFAFRELCRRCGAALTTTEMVSARALTYGDQKSRELLWLSEEESPAAVQIFGHEPTVMAEAAQMAAELSGAAILDINMGCPVGKIVKSGDGSALMKDPELAARIVEAVAGAVSIPVTANGDVFSGEDAAHLLRYTGCDAVMIGRGCFGDPWLFSRANAALNGEPEPEKPTLEERMDAALRQIERLAERRGERSACMEARHQLPWYLHGVPYSGSYRQQMVHVENLAEIRTIVSRIKRELS